MFIKKQPQDTPLKEEAIDMLIKTAGPQASVSEERSARVFAAVNQSWKDSLAEKASENRRRRTKRAYWSVAACLLVTLSIWPFSPTPSLKKVVVAEAYKVIGTSQILSDENRQTIQTGISLYENQLFETLDKSGLALTLTSGQSLRLDQNTRLYFISPNEIKLVHGAVYFDSGAKTQTREINIITPFGSARDIGTQFEVRLTPNNMVISVREGEVEIDSNTNSRQRIIATEKLILSSDGKSSVSQIAPNSLEWQWAQSLAPTFELEGRNLDQFLTLFAREMGWQINYKNSELHNHALHTKLHGSVVGMTTNDILHTLSAISNVHFELDKWVLSIYPSKAGNAADK